MLKLVSVSAVCITSETKHSFKPLSAVALLATLNLPFLPNNQFLLEKKESRSVSITKT